MTLPAYRLPDEIESGAQGGPDFKTAIQESVSGTEQRFLTWTICRARYDIAYALMNSSDVAGNYRKIAYMFYGHHGRARAFRFKAPNDNDAVNENFGPGDGTSTQFSLKKTYDPSQLILGTPGLAIHTYTRTIVLPIAGFVIKVSGVTKTITTDYTYQEGGYINFTSPPAAAAPLTWTGYFDLPMRFDTDHLPVVMHPNDRVDISSLPIREVLGEF